MHLTVWGLTEHCLGKFYECEQNCWLRLALYQDYDRIVEQPEELAKWLAPDLSSSVRMIQLSLPFLDQIRVINQGADGSADLLSKLLPVL